MNTTLNLKKYEEVEIKYTPELQTLEIKAPWMNLEFETDTENHERILNAVERLKVIDHGTGNSSEDRENLNWLLSFAYDFPVSDVEARNNLEPSKSSSASTNLLTDWLKLSPQRACEVIDSETKKLQLPSTWTWNVQEVLESARISENTFDPLAIYTRIRLLRLRSETSAKSNFNWYNELEKLLEKNTASFQKVSQFALRQTHYVTKQCVPSLKPAVDVFQEASGDVVAFIQEEKGHDRLVLRSLNGLGINDPETIELLDETKMSMEALRFSAEVSPLAFACLLGIFEGNSYTDKDPLADILERSPFPEAAKGIQTHFEINRDHNHSCVGMEMAAKLGSVSYEHAVAAARMAELVVLLGNELTARIQEKIELFREAN